MLFFLRDFYCGTIELICDQYVILLNLSLISFYLLLICLLFYNHPNFLKYVFIIFLFEDLITLWNPGSRMTGNMIEIYRYPVKSTDILFEFDWTITKIHWNPLKSVLNELKDDWHPLKSSKFNEILKSNEIRPESPDIYWNLTKISWNPLKSDWNPLKRHWNPIDITWNSLKSDWTSSDKVRFTEI